MLAKQVSAGVDWVTYLPLALCAIRMVPNADTGFSSYEIAFGRRMSGPLDIVYSRWMEDRFKVNDVSAWVETLVDRLKILSGSAVAKSMVASAKRKSKFDVHKSDKSLSLGDKVLIRVPGLKGALEASWEGPYEVEKVVSGVT